MQPLVHNNLAAQKPNSGLVKHQAVGKNGTFWMPPKTSGSSFSEVMGTKKKSLNSGKLQNVIKKNFNESKNADNKSGNAVGQRKFKTQELKNLNQLKTSVTVKMNKVGKFSNQPNILNRQSSHIHSARPINRNLNLPNSIQALVNDKQHSFKPHNLTALKFGLIKKDSGTKEEKERRKGGGADNATISSDVLKSLHRDESFQGFHSRDQRESFVPENCLQSITREVSARISEVTTEKSTVLRFSQDLPNGGKYSVKIEKFNNEISISFITPDPDFRNLLQTSLNGMIQIFEETLPSSSIVNGHIFSSYRELC